MTTATYTPSLDMQAIQADPDEDLLARYGRDADEAALEALIARHFERARRIAGRILGDAFAAEDCAQEAFARIAASARAYRPTGAFGGYLYRIVVNTARNMEKAGRRRAAHERAASARAARRGPGGTGEREGERRLEAEEIAAAVAALPPDFRYPIVLRYYEGLSHDEVAAALDLKEGTASSRLRLGLARLRDALSAAGYAAALPDLERILASGAADAAADAAISAAAASSAVAAGAVAASLPAAAVIHAAGRALAGAARRAAALKLAAAVLGIAATATVVVIAGRPGAGRPDRAGAQATARVTTNERSFIDALAGGAGHADAPAPPPAGHADTSRGRRSGHADAPASPAAGEAGGHGADEARGEAALPAGGRIAGVVLGADGSPLPGAEVRIPENEEEGRPERATTADAEGRFALEGLPVAPPVEGQSEEDARFANLVTIEARDPARALLGASTFVRVGDEAVRLRLAPGAAVRGYVVDARTREPLPGIRVEVEPVGLKIPSFREIEEEESLTSAEGAFRIGPVRAGTYRVKARPEGRAPVRSEPVALEAGKTVEVTIEVGGGATLSGRVLDPAGRPLANTVVGMYCGPKRGFQLITPEEWVEGECESRSQDLVAPRPPREGDETPLGKKVLERLASQGGDGVYAATGADGRFRMEGLPPGTRRALVVHHLFATSRPEVRLVEGEETSIEVRVERGGEIHGYAWREDGTPAAGAHVTAQRQEEGGGRDAVVEADGRYAIGGLESGPHVVTLYDFDKPKEAIGAAIDTALGKKDRGLEMQTIDVEAPGRVRLDLGPAPDGARFFGTVRRAGRPVDELAQVVLRRLDEAGAPARLAILDDAGGFEFDGVPPGRYALEVHEMWTPGEPRTVRGVVKEGSREVRCDVDLAAGSIGGRLVAPGADERPFEMPGFAIARRAGGEPEARKLALVWPDRSFELNGLAAGTWRVQVARGGVCTEETAPLTIAEGGVVRGLEIAVGRGAPLDVLVLDEHGEPVADAKVLVVPAGAPPILEAALVPGGAGGSAPQPDGSVRVPEVPDGRWDVHAWREEAAPVKLAGHAVTADRESRRVTVRLPRR